MYLSCNELHEPNLVLALQLHSVRQVRFFTGAKSVEQQPRLPSVLQSNSLEAQFVTDILNLFDSARNLPYLKHESLDSFLYEPLPSQGIIS